KAFTGVKAWHERGRLPALPPDRADEHTQAGVTEDQAGKTCDGFTLVTTDKGSQARLIDMRGQVVHQWAMPFYQAWPRSPHIGDHLAEARIHWFRCYLYPNGHLLAIYHAYGDTPYGYGLVKLDKDSRLLWKYAACAHHDIDVDEDGTIYTLVQSLASEPPPGF